MSAVIDGGAQDVTGPRCILPGCGAPTTEQGMPCEDCAASFGCYLRQTEGPAMTAEAQARRDSETHTAYAALLAGEDPARAAAVGAQRIAPAKPEGEPERKANQRCWMCEQRRTCTKQADGWECDVCREIR